VAVQFTLPAILDLDGIERWYSENNPSRLGVFKAGLDNMLATLDIFPLMGRLRDDLRLGIRQINYQQYLFFYREIEGGILIEVIVHGRRDIKGLFEDE
jgi:plasmid stabilization system protein ParE